MNQTEESWTAQYRRSMYVFFPDSAEGMWDSHYNLPAYMSSCSHAKWAFQSVSGRKETDARSPSGKKRRSWWRKERKKKRHILQPVRSTADAIKGLSGRKRMQYLGKTSLRDILGYVTNKNKPSWQRTEDKSPKVIRAGANIISWNIYLHFEVFTEVS